MKLSWCFTAGLRDNKKRCLANKDIMVILYGSEKSNKSIVMEEEYPTRLDWIVMMEKKINYLKKSIIRLSATIEITESINN